jgi:two-component system NtrC family response regulator/two-component system nitrogen regulation response regulator GlnG
LKENSVRKVLLVEEDAVLRDVLTDVITSEGHAVMTAASGEEGLAMLREQPGSTALILLDYLKKGMTPQEFMACMAADEAISAIPVILVSAKTKLAETAKTLGTTDYLAKPMKIEDLLLMVSQYLS